MNLDSELIPVRLDYDPNDVHVVDQALAFVERIPVPGGYKMILHFKVNGTDIQVQFDLDMPEHAPPLQQFAKVHLATGDCGDVAFLLVHHGQCYAAVTTFHEMKQLVTCDLDYEANPDDDLPIAQTPEHLVH